MTTYSSTSLIRVMLLDDHPLILDGIGAFLSENADISILGSFTASDALIEALQKEEVDIVLLDYSLRPDDVDGLNLIRALKARFPAVRLLIFSAFHQANIVALAMNYGADGFVGKELPSEEIMLAVRELMSGQSYLHHDMAKQLSGDSKGTDAAYPAAALDGGNMMALFTQLSQREQDVLCCCLGGMSVTQIANKFCRSVKTVSAQKKSAYKKLNVSNDHGLLTLYYQLEGRKELI